MSSDEAFVIDHLRKERDEKDARIALLERALKPVMECVIMPYLQPESLNCHNALKAVNESQSVMREFTNGESHN